MTKRRECMIRCAGCHRSGIAVEVQTVDGRPSDEPWLIPPSGWMLGTMDPMTAEWRFVCSEPCLRIVTSRLKGAEVAAELALHDKARQALDVVKTARERDRGDEVYCSHCREKLADPALSGGDEDWCSEECKKCQALGGWRAGSGGWCDHTARHLGRVNGEHQMLGEEIERLHHENAILRGKLGSDPSAREMETVAAEILALDGRATAAPWGERCGVVKHYVFSKDAREDFGASLQEMHPSDGHIVPAHDNGSLIAFYRNYAPGLARSWASLHRRTHLWRLAMSVATGALSSAEDTLLTLGKFVPPDSVAAAMKAIERVRLGLQELIREMDGAKED
jgi:hypothetical protein